MELICKSCNMDIVSKEKLKINYYINEIQSGIELVLMYSEKIQYPISLNEFSSHLSYIRNEFIFQNPFFSNKKGIIEYNFATIKFDKDTIYIEHKMLIDKNIYTINTLEDMFK